jgi:hypothetical protein
MPPNERMKPTRRREKWSEAWSGSAARRCCQPGGSLRTWAPRSLSRCWDNQLEVKRGRPCAGGTGGGRRGCLQGMVAASSRRRCPRGTRSRRGWACGCRRCGWYSHLGCQPVSGFVARWRAGLLTVPGRRPASSQLFDWPTPVVVAAAPSWRPGESGCLPFGLHLGWNSAEGRLLGFALSGSAVSSPFILQSATGPTLWTGGEYGPEGGLIGMVGKLLVAALTLGYLWQRRRLEEVG